MNEGPAPLEGTGEALSGNPPETGPDTENPPETSESGIDPNIQPEGFQPTEDSIPAKRDTGTDSEQPKKGGIGGLLRGVFSGGKKAVQAGREVHQLNKDVSEVTGGNVKSVMPVVVYKEDGGEASAPASDVPQTGGDVLTDEVATIPDTGAQPDTDSPVEEISYPEETASTEPGPNSLEEDAEHQEPRTGLTPEAIEGLRKQWAEERAVDIPKPGPALTEAMGIKPDVTEEPLAVEPDSVPAAVPDAISAVEPDVTGEPPAVVSDAVPVAEPDVAPDTVPDAIPAVEPDATPAAEPDAMPAAEPDAMPAAEPDAMPAAEPDAMPATEPDAMPASETDAAGEPPTAEPDAVPVAVPDAISAVEPDVTGEPPAVVSDAVPVAEPDSVPAAVPDAISAVEPDAVSAVVPDAIPTVVPDAAPDTVPDAIPAVEPDATPAAEPDAMPAAEPDAMPAAEPEITGELPSQNPTIDNPRPGVIIATSADGLIEARVGPKEHDPSRYRIGLSTRQSPGALFQGGFQVDFGSPSDDKKFYELIQEHIQGIHASDHGENTGQAVQYTEISPEERALLLKALEEATYERSIKATLRAEQASSGDAVEELPTPIAEPEQQLTAEWNPDVGPGQAVVTLPNGHRATASQSRGKGILLTIEIQDPQNPANTIGRPGILRENVTVKQAIAAIEEYKLDPQTDRGITHLLRPDVAQMLFDKDSGYFARDLQEEERDALLVALRELEKQQEEEASETGEPAVAAQGAPPPTEGVTAEPSTDTEAPPGGTDIASPEGTSVAPAETAAERERPELDNLIKMLDNLREVIENLDEISPEVATALEALLTALDTYVTTIEESAEAQEPAGVPTPDGAPAPDGAPTPDGAPAPDGAPTTEETPGAEEITVDTEAPESDAREGILGHIDTLRERLRRLSGEEPDEEAEPGDEPRPDAETTEEEETPEERLARLETEVQMLRDREAVQQEEEKKRKWKKWALVAGIAIGAGAVLLTPVSPLIIVGAGMSGTIGTSVGKWFARRAQKNALAELESNEDLSEEEREALLNKATKAAKWSGALEVIGSGSRGIIYGAMIGNIIEAVIGPVHLGVFDAPQAPTGVTVDPGQQVGQDIPSGQQPPGQVPPDQVPPGQVSPEQLPPGQVSPVGTPTGGEIGEFGIDSIFHGNHADFSQFEGWDVLTDHRGWRGLDILIKGGAKYPHAQGAAANALKAFMSGNNIPLSALNGKSNALLFHKGISGILSKVSVETAMKPLFDALLMAAP